MSRSKYIGQVMYNLEILNSFIKKSEKGSYNRYFKVKCVFCKQVFDVNGSALINNIARCKCQYKYRSHNVQGMSNTRLNRVYRSMLERCENKNCKAYKYYGGRGINVCDEWKNSYLSFRNWALGNGYEEETLPNGKNRLTIDRINNNGNYEPSNCRWVEMSIQCKNKNKRIKSTNGSR